MQKAFMARTWVCLFPIATLGVLTLATSAGQGQKPRDPVHPLIKAINSYRKTKGLPAVPVSAKLTKVAQTHLQDLIKNAPHKKAGTLTAWSNKGKWKAGTPGRGGAKSWWIMWGKPKELTGYPNRGFELAYYGFGNQGSINAAMRYWQKNSNGQNVLLNKGRYKGGWKGVGAAQGNGFFLVWFGE